MSPEEAETLEFNPLDVTKDWPESRFPLQPVGRMTLDRNVSNFFNESEMLAFSPALVVPGIAFTEDRMLQTRLFSYADTTRYRLGKLLFVMNES
jgi:catalase